MSKLKIESTFGEFVTIYNEADEEIVEFQSDEIDKLEDSVCGLLDYLNVEYEFKQK
ncbi:hypothetical protein [Paraclostridium bifermentans]|uniref:hypothetical protein n=1 Tax=Paraclostridium bifermentans TaxID=1490 RepID=UPI0018A0E717|nr:hypothetical protein [Paraclostridium bifermentans]